jgi:hypothetical protein
MLSQYKHTARWLKHFVISSTVSALRRTTIHQINMKNWYLQVQLQWENLLTVALFISQEKIQTWKLSQHVYLRHKQRWRGGGCCSCCSLM